VRLQACEGDPTASLANPTVVCALRGLIDLVHPQLEDAMTDPAVRQKPIGGGPQLHPRLADHPAPGAARTNRRMIRRFSGRRRREWDAATGAAAGLDGWLRFGTACLSAMPHPAAGSVATLLTGELARRARTSAPASLRSAVQPAPARDPSPPQGRAGRCDQPRCTAAQEQLHLSGRVPLGRTGWHRTLPSGETRWLQAPPAGSGPANGPRDFYAVSGLLHHCRAW